MPKNLTEILKRIEIERACRDCEIVESSLAQAHKEIVALLPEKKEEHINYGQGQLIRIEENINYNQAIDDTRKALKGEK